jgi:hypothetical protein
LPTMRRLSPRRARRWRGLGAFIGIRSRTGRLGDECDEDEHRDRAQDQAEPSLASSAVRGSSRAAPAIRNQARIFAPRR